MKKHISQRPFSVLYVYAACSLMMIVGLYSIYWAYDDNKLPSQYKDVIEANAKLESWVDRASIAQVQGEANRANLNVNVENTTTNQDNIFGDFFKKLPDLTPVWNIRTNKPKNSGLTNKGD